jgi:hypothetical protein
MKTNIFFLLFVLTAGQTPKAAAQSPGTFAPTGSMTAPRTHFTATLLADGRVLIAGGYMRGGGPIILYQFQSSAELYDPRTGMFSATGDMTTPRSGHTATLLPDGKVLIAGGRTNANTGTDADYFATLASAEIYDPGTGAFSATGEMSTARWGSSATLLNNGRVLFAGGLTAGVNSYVPVAAELYDPATGTSAATGNIFSEWTTDTATLLVNGKVLVTRFTPRAELYDPSTNTFSGTGQHDRRYGSTATLLTNGKVLVAGGGGEGEDSPAPLAELYDSDSGTFARTGALIAAPQGHSATLLPDGAVLFAGGGIHNASIYEPINGTYTTIGGLLGERYMSHTATLLNDGRILIAGGIDRSIRILSSAELYTPRVLIPAPVLLSLSGDGKGQGAILHANTSQVAASDSPATAGEALEIYFTGFGDGSLIPPQVAIGGRMAEVLWFGKAPASAGLNQVNVRVPAGVAAGRAVPVRLSYLGRSTNEVTIGVQ